MATPRLLGSALSPSTLHRRRRSTRRCHFTLSTHSHAPRSPPRYRRPSLGHFTSLFAWYRNARQPLYDFAAAPSQVKEDVAAAAERRFGAYHREVASSLNLVPLAESSGWRDDVLAALEGELNLLCDGDEGKKAQARESARRLVEGRWIARSLSNVPSAASLLRGLSGHGALPTVVDGGSSVNPFDEVLRLVQLVLEIRKIEVAHLEGNLLDPMARTLLTTLEDYFRLVSLLSSPSRADAAPQHGSLVRLGRNENGSFLVLEASPEQDRVIHSPRTPGLTGVIAGAGTGKTTAMAGFAQRGLLLERLGEGAVEHPPTCIVRSRRLRAKLAPFFRASQCMTLAALVKRSLEAEYGERFRKKWMKHDGRGPGLRELYHAEVMHALEIPEKGWMVMNTDEDRRERLSGKRIAERILRGLRHFVSSADPVISSGHFHKAAKQPYLPVEELVSLAEKLWTKMIDMDDVSAPLPFDAQAKFRQLDVFFHVPGEGPLVVDEVQDLTPCELDLLFRERSLRRVLALGDPLQAIDGWRGASDQWVHVPADANLSLLQTHRFGGDIAAVANARLLSDNVDEGRMLIGRSGKVTPVYRQSVTTEEGRTSLYPHYNALFFDLYKRMVSDDPPSSFRLLSSTNFHPPTLIRLLRHSYHLFRDLKLCDPRSDDRLHSYHPALARFDTWKAFKDEIESWGNDLPENPEDRYTPWWWATHLEEKRMLQDEDFLEVVNEMERRMVKDDEESEITLTIPHQAKGLEFERVVVSPTFHSHIQLDAFNLLHVALTRANETLEIPDQLLKELALSSYGLHNFHLSSAEPFPTLTTCSNCNTPSAAPLIHHHTPFPFHPSHSPAPPDADEPVGLLDEAYRSYTTLGWERFPICVECAGKSAYRPLKEFATFAAKERKLSTAKSGATEGGTGGVRFEGFVAETMEREGELREKADDEVALRRF
ncbi:hypothetical protein JCM6882_000096 [Rhodosporidiobolus microsporus]